MPTLHPTPGSRETQSSTPGSPENRSSKRSRWRHLLLLLALVLPLGGAAKKCNYPEPSGQFIFHDGSPAADGGADILALQDGYIQTESGCPRTKAELTPFYSSGPPDAAVSWEVKVKFPFCKNLEGPIVIEAIIDATGSAIQGKWVLANGSIFDLVATLSVGDSVRFATQNTQFLPSFFAAGTSEENGRKLAKRILASGYDFIALNEVFDADLQELMVNELGGTFPYWVQYLDAADLEDSGLQIFSRFPFEPLPFDTYEISPLECVASDHGVAQSIFNVGKADCEKVAFIEFDECEGDDCFSSKGAAYVRLRNPSNNDVYNVIWTHMQANYVPADYPNEKEDFVDAVDARDVRIAQMADIEKLLVATIGQSAVFDEDTFILGDLNIDGHLDAPDLGFIGPNEVNIHEWNYHFDTAGSFYKEIVWDAWALENSPKDPSGNYDRGVTNASHWGGGGPGARLDYILRTWKSRKCAQHMSLTHNLRWSDSGGTFIETGMGPNGVGIGGVEDISDHFGINMDLNTHSTHCNPARAKVVTLPSNGNVGLQSGTLTKPGQIVWYRFDEAGTYSFQMTSPNGVDFRVYESTDMTTPAPSYKNEVTKFTTPRGLPFEGKEFRMSNAPFYVRVYHPNRMQTGNYVLGAVKHDCGSQILACALAPGERVERKLQDTPPLNGADEEWFEIVTEQTPGDILQKLELQVRDIPSSPLNWFKFRLLEDDGTTLVQKTSTPEADPEGGRRLKIDETVTVKKKYYLQVQRLPAGPAPYPVEARSYTMHWTTDLTIFYGAGEGGQSIRMWCLEENDGFDLDGDDELYFEYAKIDGVTVVPGTTFIGDFDAGTKWPMEQILGGKPLYFAGTDDLRIRVYEEDGAAAGDDDEHTIIIPKLDRDTLGPVEDDQVFAPGGSGKYRFFYNVTHGFDH